nr:hypothetical protein [uncultured Methanoregula sp.]
MNSVEYPGAVPATRTGKVPSDLPDPVLAGIFALVGISLGQFYNGRPIRGICWGALGIAVFLVIQNSIYIAPAGIFFLAACVVDAYSTAEEIRSRTIPCRGISLLFWLELTLAISLVIALGIPALVRILPVTNPGL